MASRKMPGQPLERRSKQFSNFASTSTVSDFQRPSNAEVPGDESFEICTIKMEFQCTRLKARKPISFARQT